MELGIPFLSILDKVSFRNHDGLRLLLGDDWWLKETILRL